MTLPSYPRAPSGSGSAPPATASEKNPAATRRPRYTGRMTERLPARELLAKVGGCLLVAALLASRVLQLPYWPGCIREVRGLRPWVDRWSFLPAALAPPAFDLEAWYAALGYGRAQI